METFNNAVVVKGRKGFKSQYKEPRGEAIALRLPESLDQKIRAAAGCTPITEPKDSPEAKEKRQENNVKLKQWIESVLEAAIVNSNEQPSRESTRKKPQTKR